MRNALSTFLVALVVLLVPIGAFAGTTKSQFTDADDNGIPDAGEVVTGKYTFAEDFGDTTCKYQVQYRGAFENTPYLDSGWITNNINCRGADNGSYNYLIVHETDPRYTGNPDWAVWGNWEYHVLTETGSGNLVRRPETSVGVN
jgi:hypothetical protein